jgi:glycosyltransferase involved in cell wall biosynthesis
MRVLHLLEATLGGTRVYLDNIIASSRELPFETTLVHADARSDSGFPATLARARDAGWQTIEVPMIRRVDPPADLRAAIRVARILREVRPDVLHCHSSKAGGVGRLATMLSPARPLVVYSPHALAANTARRYLLMERALARLTHRFAAISDSEKTEIIGFGLTDDRGIDVIYPVVDGEQYAPRPQDEARLELGLAPGPLLIGIGRLTEQKDPLGFVRTVDHLKRMGSPARALWIGDGELREAVEGEIRDRDLGACLEVLGWKDDVKPYIAAADVLLSTARFESFGYAVAEALSMLRPAVSSRVTGTVDVIRDGAVPLLYPAGDHAAAATLIHRLLGDPDEAGRLAVLGREVIRREFSRPAMTRRIARAYAHAPGADPALAEFARPEPKPDLVSRTR